MYGECRLSKREGLCRYRTRGDRSESNHQHALSYEMQKQIRTPKHTGKQQISNFLLIHLPLSCNSHYLLHSGKHIRNHILPCRAHTPMNQPGALLHLAPPSYSVSPLVQLPLIHCWAAIRCTLDKPIWLFFPPAFIYMQLSSKTNSRQCTADCIFVSPPRSYYTAHELWIVVGLRRRSAGNHKGQSPWSSKIIDNSKFRSSWSL